MSASAIHAIFRFVRHDAVAHSAAGPACGRAAQMALVAALALAAPAQAANPAAGAGLYTQFCAGCHGADGRGSSAGAPDFTRGQGLLAADAALVRNLRAGGRGMPSYEGLLREQQLLDVVAYLRTLQR